MLRAAAALAAAALAAASNIPFSIQVQNPNYVVYPNKSLPSFPDQSTLALNFTTHLEGYNGWGNTYRFIDGSSLNAMTPDLEYQCLWDLEGAVVVDATHAIGSVHNEHGWEYNGSYRFNGYITFAGYDATTRTWQPNSPDRNETIIITSAGPANIGGPDNTGTGPHWMVRVGAYLYLYTWDAYALDPVTGVPSPAYVVVRSAVADGGLPGSWWKWLNGTWSQPGLGGNATALPNLNGAKMVWLEAYSLWLAVAYDGTMSTSTDGFTWTALPSTLFPPTPADQPLAGFANPNKYYYTSWVPGYGGFNLAADDTLNLYYLFNAATNESWADVARGLAAVQINLQPVNGSGAPLPFVTVVLSNYLFDSSPSPGSDVAAVAGSTARPMDARKVLDLAPSGLGGANKDYWATGISPVDLRVYQYGWRLGEVLASPADWTAGPLVPLIDCYISDTNDHFVARVGECQPRGDNHTYEFLGTIGYALANNETAVPAYELMALWRCFDAANNNHYVNPLVGCRPTDQDPTVLGYILWQND